MVLFALAQGEQIPGIGECEHKNNVKKSHKEQKAERKGASPVPYGL